MSHPDRRVHWVPSRREVLALGFGCFAVAVPLARRRPLTLVRRNVAVMGTIAEIAVAHREPLAAHGAIDAAAEALRQVERAMTRFDPASDVGRANRVAAAGPVPITAATAEVLDEALWWAEATNGAFDPCLARAVALWDVGRRHEPPPEADIARLANRRLFRLLELDRRAGRPVVRFHDGELGLDLGGIAKGYGVDRAVAALRERGIGHALVGAGGDLYALGRAPSGEPWRIGIRSPDHPTALAGTLEAEDLAVATSGDYAQFFRHGGERYHHLLDPLTGAPRRTARRSVTVVAPSCMAADAAATAVFGMAPEAAGRLLARRGGQLRHLI
jgi:FAD:protein FMN transferase